MRAGLEAVERGMEAFEHSSQLAMLVSDGRLPFRYVANAVGQGPEESIEHRG